MATSEDLEAALVAAVGEGKLAQPAWVGGTAPQLPYALLMPGAAEMVNSTDMVWERVVPYTAYVCTEARDRALELAVMRGLDAAGITYDLSFEYLSDERVFSAIFSTEPVVEVYPAYAGGSED